jgi:hypothetical protein
MLSVEGDLHDEIPLAAPVSENIVEQVTEYFTPTAEKLADATDAKN